MNEALPEALAQLPCGWLSMRPDGGITAANAAACTLTGRSEAELLGQNFSSLLSGAARVIHQTYMQPLLSLHGHVAELALTLRQPGDRSLEVLVYTHKRGEGPQACIEVVLAPIGQRRRIEDEMLRIKRAADQAPGLIFQLVESTPEEPRFTYASEAVRTLYGCSAEAAERSAEAVFGRVLEADRPGLHQARHDAAAQGTPWHTVYRVTAGDGATRWHELHASPRTLAHGVVLWHGHVADITQRHALEMALAEQQTQERIHLARSEFLSRISHELRTPLNGIIGFARLLQTDAADNLSATQQARLGTIGASGQHLLQLVGQVLEVSRLEAQQLAVDLEPCAVGPCVAQALALVRPMALEAGIELRQVTDDPDLQLLANPTRLHQALVNLLSNAIKFNRRGGYVEVHSRPGDDGSVSLDVRDNGLGLSAAQQQALFQPFNRLGAEHTHQEGFGLGLVITKHLLELMGGRLRVHSLPGEGSTFSIQLPQAVARRLPPQTTATAESGLATNTPSTQGAVLYVEDNPVNGLLMEAIAGMRPGVDLRVAVDGASALKTLETFTPDLLLLDMHLPDTNGIDLLSAMRRQPSLQGVPAVVVSAAARVEDIERARAHGFAGYWTKPLDVDRTLAELDAYLSPARPGNR